MTTQHKISYIYESHCSFDHKISYYCLQLTLVHSASVVPPFNFVLNRTEILTFSTRSSELFSMPFKLILNYVGVILNNSL